VLFKIDSNQCTTHAIKPATALLLSGIVPATALLYTCLSAARRAPVL
jgi:hypothetical protein